MNSNEIIRKLDRINELPTLPAIAVKVNRLVDEGGVSAKNLSQIIEKDQALAAKLLKLVNSVFFGIRAEISNVSHAIAFLGNDMVRDAVISVSIINLFSSVNLLKGFDITDFWSHSISVAITSKHLAEKTGVMRPEKCFMGGLLHDIGKVVLCAYFSDLFEKVWNSHQENDLEFYETENMEISTNHAKIGGIVAERWKLPPHMIDAIGRHHDPGEDVSDFDYLKIVHLSDVVVNRFANHPNGETDRPTLHPDIQKDMGALLDSSTEWHPEIAEEIQAACVMFLG
ncbi:MAG: HDOD domain-containing protein [Desulfobacterales bacterium]|nr:HDOD domain-containing protein [Desulfobacterales bacterium]